jgi:hypothetical protein
MLHLYLGLHFDAMRILKIWDDAIEPIFKIKSAKLLASREDVKMSYYHLGR